jgi:hypothetical protein
MWRCGNVEIVEIENTIAFQFPHFPHYDGILVLLRLKDYRGRVGKENKSFLIIAISHFLTRFAKIN